MTRKKSPNVYKSCPKMISPEKWWILTPLQKLPKNVGDLSKLIVAKGFENLPVQSDHTVRNAHHPWISLVRGDEGSIVKQNLVMVIRGLFRLFSQQRITSKDCNLSERAMSCNYLQYMALFVYLQFWVNLVCKGASVVLPPLGSIPSVPSE